MAPFPIGAKLMQRLRQIDVEAWHTELRTVGRKDGKGGVSSRTIGHAHRILSKALKEAVKFDLTVRNAAGRDGQRAPKVDAQEVEIVPADKIGDIVTGDLSRKGNFPQGHPCVVHRHASRRDRRSALAQRESQRQADRPGCENRSKRRSSTARSFKATKTRSGLRDISLPDIIVEALTEHRLKQLEQRLAMGLGEAAGRCLRSFPSLPDGGPQYPRNLSGEWKEACALVGIDPPVTFLALRHSHASQLIAAGVDVVTVSKRLGHASPQITLQVYAHLWNKRDDQAAAVINAAIGALNVTHS